MVEKRSLVLVAGIGRGPFEALAPVLDRQKLEVVKVAAPEMSVELARSEPCDLIIFDAEVKEGSLEDKLSLMTALVLAAENEEQKYGLRLPGTLIEQGYGSAHKHACLQALAVFRQPDFNQEFMLEND